MDEINIENREQQAHQKFFLEKQLKQIEKAHLKIANIHPESVSESILRLQRYFLNKELNEELSIHGIVNKKVKI